MAYVVEIVQYKDEKVIETIKCGDSLAKAEKVDKGVNINLNHEEFFTRISKTGEQKDED